jgi:hypothetical protein
MKIMLTGFILGGDLECHSKLEAVYSVQWAYIYILVSVARTFFSNPWSTNVFSRSMNLRKKRIDASMLSPT